MPYYVFAIGGTGARCLESLIHLCAMGLGPEQPIHPILVDPDAGNGNVNRTLELIIQYKKIRDQIQNAAQDDFFKTEIIYDDQQLDDATRTQIPNRYNPNSDLPPGSNTLAHFIEYNTVLSNDAHKHLADLLFSSEELNMKMTEGYRGVPSIGALLMTNIQNQAFWAAIQAKLLADTSSKVFVFASVFGGTGASGYPVISQLLKNHAPSSRVGGALLLPYFKLKDPVNLINQRADLAKEKILPNSNSFLINSKEACRFYANNFNGNDSNYVLGDDYALCKEYDDYEIGADKQKNDAHVIEMIAAYAALDFWNRSQDNYQKFYKLIVNNPPDNSLEPSKIVESDIPDTSKGKPFERFAILYHYVNDIYHLIESQKSKELNKIAWLRKIIINGIRIKGHDLIEQKDTIGILKKYVNSFKTWINMIHTNTPQLELLDSELRLETLLKHDNAKYKTFRINCCDVKCYGVTTDQQTLIGSMLKVLSRSKLAKVRK